MFKKIPHSKRKKVKVVETITKESEHICTEKCFKPRKKLVPQDLRRVDLGYIYQDNEGHFYSDYGEGEFLEVTGLTFTRGAGGLHLMFHPAQQLHIHSLGGKTIEKTTVNRNARVNDEFHLTEAAKKLKRKGLNLGDSIRKISLDVKKVIPKAARRKTPVKGTGRGASGVPRTEAGKQVIKLIQEGKPKNDVFAEIIKWAAGSSKLIAGPHKSSFKKLVDRWWYKINSTHK